MDGNEMSREAVDIVREGRVLGRGPIGDSNGCQILPPLLLDLILQCGSKQTCDSYLASASLGRPLSPAHLFSYPVETTATAPPPQDAAVALLVPLYQQRGKDRIGPKDSIHTALFIYHKDKVFWELGSNCQMLQNHLVERSFLFIYGAIKTQRHS